jgi:hypothetical protein
VQKRVEFEWAWSDSDSVINRKNDCIQGLPVILNLNALVNGLTKNGPSTAQWQQMPGEGSPSGTTLTKDRG